MSARHTSCRRCRAQLIAHTVWREADTHQRTIWRAAHANVHKGRGLCQRCYVAASKDGTLVDYERTTVSEAEVVAEWTELDDGDGSRAQRVARLAPRLGMTPDALERALDRAGIRGETQQATAPRRGGGCAECGRLRWALAEVLDWRDSLRTRVRGTSHPERLAHLQAQLDEATEKLADARASLDWHTEADHDGQVAA